MKALIAQKLGMTQLFDAEGNVERVTVLQAGPCVVTQVKTTAKDGYNAVQLGFGQAKKPNRPLMGHLKAANTAAKVLKEIRLSDIDPTSVDADVEAEVEVADTKLKVGSTLDVSSFEVGDKIQVTGTSKGKGFAGTIKRHNFHRGPKTHGSHNYRAPGSIGAGYPEHVMKGMKMAGQMGHQQTTVRGLKVVMVDPAKHLLAVSGAVPGPRKGIIVVRGSNG